MNNIIKIDNKFYNKYKVVMLATDKAENCLHKVDGSLIYRKQYFTQEYLKSINVTSHHLYILSDEEIKEGDWVIEFIFNNPDRAIRVNKDDLERCLENYKQGSAKKIIATTDRLNINPNIADSYRSANCVSFIPQSFLETFVKEQGKIEDVLVEHEEYCEKLTCKDEQCTVCCKNILYRPKLSPTNEITIKLVEEKERNLDRKKNAVLIAFIN